MKKKILLALGIFSALFIAIIHVEAQQTAAVVEPKLDVSAPDGIRPGGTLNQELPAPKISRDRISADPGIRNYPEQPPTIPHNIRDYQMDKNFNMCLSCHSRSASPQTGAPMVSITHYYDRDGQALGAVSPRRYFCVQCHLPQADVKPARTNNFQSIDSVLQTDRAEKE
ncbi:MAG: nitrate reductase cytochrome c-type subunit [Cellvibrio sp.]